MFGGRGSDDMREGNALLLPALVRSAICSLQQSDPGPIARVWRHHRFPSRAHPPPNLHHGFPLSRTLALSSQILHPDDKLNKRVSNL